MKLINWDCFEEMQKIETWSVDLILVDPPYWTMKGMERKDRPWSWGDLNYFKWDTALNIKDIFDNSNRILRKNWKLILFSMEPYTSKMITSAIPNLPFNYRLFWKKDHFANCLFSKKAPVSYIEDIVVFTKQYDFEGLHPLRKYFKNVLDFIWLKLTEINKKLWHRKAEHSFYVTTPKRLIKQEIWQKADHTFRVWSSQFGLCTEKTYNELIEKFEIDKMEWFKKYDEFKNVNDWCINIFNLPEWKKIKSNILEYKKDYTHYHPTEKPIKLLEDLIKTYTNKDNLVVDFCCGAWSCWLACKNTERDFIGIEKEKEYYNISKKRLWI